MVCCQAVSPGFPVAINLTRPWGCWSQAWPLPRVSAELQSLQDQEAAPGLQPASGLGGGDPGSEVSDEALFVLDSE